MNDYAAPVDEIRVRYVGAPRMTDQCDCARPCVVLGTGQYPFESLTMQRCNHCGTVYILPEYTEGMNAVEMHFSESAFLVAKDQYRTMCKFVDRILVGDGCDDLNDWDGGEIQELAVKCGFLKPTDITTFPCGEVCPCTNYFDPEDAQEQICYRVTDAFRRVQAGAKDEST